MAKIAVLLTLVVAWVTRIEDLCEHWLEVFINTIVEPKSLSAVQHMQLLLLD